MKHAKKYDGKAAQIVAFLAQSESPGDRAKAHRNAGLCRAVLLELDKLPRKKGPEREYESHEESGIESEGSGSDSNKKQKQK